MHMTLSATKDNYYRDFSANRDFFDLRLINTLVYLFTESFLVDGRDEQTDGQRTTT